MTDTSNTADETILNLTGQAAHLIGMAARAPSVHNTQPWRFKIGETAIELYADPTRQLLEDPAGREMLVSCGAALYGLRLGIRSLGYLPETDALSYRPEAGSSARHGRQRPLARVRPGRVAPLTADEQALLQAVLRRHTHRGPFEPGPLPAGLLARLHDDVTAEGATLAVVEAGPAYDRLAAILATWSRQQDLYPTSHSVVQSRAETQQWTRDASSRARDGVPGFAFPAVRARTDGWLPQRDFDLGRGWGLPSTGGAPPEVTAILVTSGDHEEDWLRAGQALQRMLLRAASQWVFASLQTGPLQAPATRALIQYSLALPGWPQMLLQLGVARTAHATARRPVVELA